MKRKILSVILCAAIFSAALCTGVQAAGMGEFQRQRTYSGQFHDIGGKWYEPYIADLYEYGLAEGMGENTMAPNEPVTVAQIVALAARVNAKYYDGTIPAASEGGKWYEPYISYALDYGLLTESENSDVDRPATRGESALILSRTLPDWQFDKISDAAAFSDVGEDEPCRDAVARLCRAGVINGYEDGSFRPAQGISRAEAMTIVDRIVNKSLRPGYNEWLQSQKPSEGESGSGDKKDPDPIGVGVGFGRATFMLPSVAMVTVDMENSSFTLAVNASETGGMVTMAGVCEVKTDNSGNILMSCVVTDRAAQGGASETVAKQAAALEMLGFTYDGAYTLTFTEAIVNRTSFADTTKPVIGMMKLGAKLTVAN